MTHEFRTWAEHGCRLYGGDPWFFLRELAQNSRDAGARTIRVEVGRRGEVEYVAFADDGSGMGLEHARRYLFTLYASSKEDDPGSAGKFGIGFWSVLRFEPDRILVESRTRREAWAIAIDERFDLAGTECLIEHRGTRVTLERRARHDDEAALVNDARAGLDRFCRHLRRNDRAARVLPVLMNGRSVSRPMSLPGPVSLTFRDGQVEGAVGLGDTPSVHLNARGLPVWRGTTLDELSHTAKGSGDAGEIGRGLSPVFLLNGNDLNVIASRRAVVDDAALARVRRKARDALARLVGMHMDRTFPRSLARRILDFVESAPAGPLRLGWATAILAIGCFALAAVVAWNLPSPLARRGQSGRSILSATYAGPAVTDGRGSAALDLSYEPPTAAWFKILTADRFDAKRGFAVGEAATSPLPDFRCTRDLVSVRVRSDAGGRTAVPLPPGYALDTDSMDLDGEPLRGAMLTPSGDTVVDVPHGGGVLAYSCCPGSREAGTTPAADLVALPPGTDLPPSIALAVGQASRKKTEARVVAALVLTRMLVEYDVSREAARAYADLGGPKSWLGLVLDSGRGDCDVMNGLNALLLRKMGVPARLAIGVVGENGRARPEMHAWTEYHDGTWKLVDATPAFEGTVHDARHAGSRPGDAPLPGAPGPLPTVISLAPAKRPAGATGHLPPRTPQAARREASGARPALAAAAAIAITCLAVLGAAILVRRSRWMHMQALEDPAVAEDVLARIVASASSNPRMWRHARRLWQHDVLPLLDGRRISVNRAIGLARRGRLFIGRRANPLADEAARSGSVVLDREGGPFGPFVERLAGAVDLDAIAAIDPGNDGGDLSRLLARVNDLLSASGGGEVRAAAAPGLEDADVRDVDLTGLRLPRSSRWPRRFVAVNPASGSVRDCLSLHRTNPDLATFRMIAMIVSGSRMLAGKADGIRLRAVRRILEEAR